MRITQHAKEKYWQGRTQTRPEDIIAMLSSGIGIELGAVNGYRYVYFYSLQDNGAKIAVVSNDEQTLVSIWGSGYYLPEGVRTPTAEDLVLAHRKLLNWLNLDKKMREKPAEKDTEGTLELFVFEGTCEEYRHELPVTFKQVDSKWKMIDLLKPQLRTIATLTSEMPSVKVHAQFVVDGKVLSRHVIDRQSLDEVLEHWHIKQSKKKPVEDLGQQGTLRLVVLEGEKVEYEKEFSTTLGAVDTKHLATSLLASDLELIAKTTEGMRSVYVQVRFFVANSPIRKYLFSREDLDGFLPH